MSEQPFGAGKEQGEQGSLDWLMSRVGHCTASRFNDVLAKLKNGKPSEKRNTYMWEVAVERITGKPTEHYATAAMLRGQELEPFARLAYEAKTGTMVNETGFHHHLTIPMCGASPDGMIDDDGCIEIKVPWNAAYHLQCFLDGAMPDEHYDQVQGVMWVTGRQYCDFISYNPDMPEEFRLFISRIDRDNEYIANLEKEVILFLAEVDDLVLRLQMAAKGER